MPPVFLPALLATVSDHNLEVADTLIQVGRFLLIFLAARTVAEVMVRLQLPTILGELVAGVLIGVSGLHFLVPAENAAELSGLLVQLVANLAGIGSDQVREIYAESFAGLEQISNLGLYALLFLTGLESELDELVAVGGQAISVAVTGVVLPFALGCGGLLLLFHQPLLLAIFAGASTTSSGS
jgi:Kef-type K+ transport system membrane component KefB